MSAQELAARRSHLMQHHVMYRSWSDDGRRTIDLALAQGDANHDGWLTQSELKGALDAVDVSGEGLPRFVRKQMKRSIETAFAGLALPRSKGVPIP